jgi:hypothetical protein
MGTPAARPGERQIGEEEQGLFFALSSKGYFDVPSSTKGRFCFSLTNC